MLLGMVASMFAGLWKYVVKVDFKPEDRPLARLFALMDRVRDAQNETEVMKAEQEIDEILLWQAEKYAPGEIDAGEAAAVSVATHRLEYLVGRRRAVLSSGLGPVLVAQAPQASSPQSASKRARPGSDFYQA